MLSMLIKPRFLIMSSLIGGTSCYTYGLYRRYESEIWNTSRVAEETLNATVNTDVLYQTALFPSDRLLNLLDRTKKSESSLRVDDIKPQNTQLTSNALNTLRDFREKCKHMITNILEDRTNKARNILMKFKEPLAAEEATLLNLQNTEKNILKEIEDLDLSYGKSIEDLDLKISQLNSRRVDLYKAIQSELDVFNNKVDQSERLLKTEITNELHTICSKYEKELKSYYVNFSKSEKEDFGKRELLKKLNDMMQVKKRFKIDELEKVKTHLLDSNFGLNSKSDEIKTLYQEFVNVSNDYKALNIEKFEFLNKKNSIAKMREQYISLKNDSLVNSANQAKIKSAEMLYNEFAHDANTFFSTEILGTLDDILKKTIFKESLFLGDNKSFISDFYVEKNNEVMLALKFLTSKNNHTYTEANNSLEKIVSDNFNKLYLNSKYFNDNFTKDIIEQSGILNKRFVNKTQIMNEFNSVKKNALFNVFFTSSSLSQFLFSNLIENTIDFWMKYFDPTYHSIYSTDTEAVRKIKALSFINYHLKHDNYPEAYKYFQYVNNIECLNGLKAKVGDRTQFLLMIDLLQRHFH